MWLKWNHYKFNVRISHMQFCSVFKWRIQFSLFTFYVIFGSNILLYKRNDINNFINFWFNFPGTIWKGLDKHLHTCMYTGWNDLKFTLTRTPFLIPTCWQKFNERRFPCYPCTTWNIVRNGCIEFSSFLLSKLSLTKQKIQIYPW